jgi:hypothetical protein
MLRFINATNYATYTQTSHTKLLSNLTTQSVYSSFETQPNLNSTNFYHISREDNDTSNLNDLFDQIYYLILDRSNELWKSVLLVSNQGSKKGRSKRRGAAKAKDLNAGQNLGDGKLQVVWPGLNSDIIDKKNVP